MVIRADLTTLRMFLAVYRQGNITKAAEREHIAPSAISKRIQDLEAEAGAPLFYRHARGMTATPAGETLARHAAGLFERFNHMEADLSAFATGERGLVRIHAHQSAVVQHLPQDLAAFRRAHPDINVVLREETSPNVLQSMMDGLGDISAYSPTTRRSRAVFSSSITSSTGSLPCFPPAMHWQAVTRSVSLTSPARTS